MLTMKNPRRVSMVVQIDSSWPTPPGDVGSAGDVGAGTVGVAVGFGVEGEGLVDRVTRI